LPKLDYMYMVTVRVALQEEAMEEVKEEEKESRKERRLQRDKKQTTRFEEVSSGVMVAGYKVLSVILLYCEVVVHRSLKMNN